MILVVLRDNNTSKKMEFRFTPTIVVMVVSIYFVHVAVAMPRTVERQDEILPLDHSVGTAQLEKTTINPSVPDTKVLHSPGRIPCQFEEPTEEFVCQEHCLPKGYNYGLCTNFICSCI